MSKRAVRRLSGSPPARHLITIRDLRRHEGALLDVDARDHIALVAEADDGTPVGIARVIRDRHARGEAEVRWIFPELSDEGFAPWDGVRHVYVMGANQPSHAVDVTDSLPAGIDSLRAHEGYLRGLGRDFDPEEFLRGFTAEAGRAIGVAHAVAFGRIRLQGV